MKYEDRIQLKVDELTTAFFDHVIAYYLSKPSGLGGPGCVIMVSDEGKSYQFHGSELDQLNYYSEWQLLFPILRKSPGLANVQSPLLIFPSLFKSANFRSPT